MTEKNVSINDWTIFALMLIIVSTMFIVDIIDQFTSTIIIIISCCVLLFEKYVIERNMTICFHDRNIEIETHEYYIKSFNNERWLNILLLTIIICGLRAASIFGYIYFTSGMVITLITAGLLFGFKDEIMEYFEYLFNCQDETIKTLEDREIDLIHSIYESRAIFSGIMIGITLAALIAKSIIAPMESMFIYSIVIGIIYYTYDTSIEARIGSLSKTIFRKTPYNKKNYSNNSNKNCNNKSHSTCC